MTPAQVRAGRLVVCPTPIGNLEDVTLRVLSVLGSAEVVACEDTRRTGRLLAHHGLSASLVSLHEHNEPARSAQLLARVRAGDVVALLSDAGTPLVSDPGFELVRACIAAQLPLEVLPGPSAVTTALVASGLPPDRWCFVGFLPRKAAELRALLTGAAPTLVAFESPRRLPATLRAIAALDPQRPAVVCRELTKLHEEVRRGTAEDLAAHYSQRTTAGRLRGEIVLVLGGAARERSERGEAVAALLALVQAGARARPAAAAVARLTGLGANELYRELTGGARVGSGRRPV
jgi:16S rRNA (cytidine1402-2'-O)-methyltransferase